MHMPFGDLTGRTPAPVPGGAVVGAKVPCDNAVAAARWDDEGFDTIEHSA